ncbi:MAG: hypothetical protein IJZ74_10690 [Clostridia bacterium]|nr:hypothetical protein [Clostridia bacterium]
MTDLYSPLPVVADTPLPVPELRAPLYAADASPASQVRRWDDLPDISGLCDLLEPAISAAIARKARQRRYTP